MSIRTVLFIIISIPVLSWGASIYKCESDDGKSFFQDRPCNKNQKTTMKKESVAALDRKLLTKDQKIFLDFYVLNEKAKALFIICKSKQASSSSELKSTVKRFGVSAKSEINKGRNLYEKGTKNISSKSFHKYVKGRVAESEFKLRSLSDQSSQMACRGINRKYSRLTKKI